MTKYSLIYMYRKKHDAGLDLSDRENWDGEHMISLETDRPLDKDDLLYDWREIMRTIALEGGYEAVSIVRFAEVVEDESSDGR